MTNEEKAKEIGQKFYFDTMNSNEAAYKGALQMAQWKDSQLNLILDAIDHAYLQTDGSYGDLSYEVIDKARYLKSLIV